VAQSPAGGRFLAVCPTGPLLFNVAVDDLGPGTDCTLTKTEDSTKLGEQIDIPEGPGEAGEINPQQHHEVQQTEAQSPAPEQEQTQAQVYASPSLKILQI